MGDDEHAIANKRSRATLLLQQQRYDMALTAIRELLVLLPDDAYAHTCLSICLTQLKQLDEAEREARIALALSPDSDFAHHSHSLCMAARNRLPEAEASARQALQYSPENPDYHAFLAAVLGRQRRWDEAADSLAAGLQLDPEHATCLKLRTTVGLARQDDPAIEHAVGELTRIGPDQAEAHAARGFRSIHRMEVDQAAEAFREAMRDDPNSAEAKIGLAYCLRMQSPLYARLLVLPHAVEINLRKHCWIFTIAASFVCWLIAAAAAENRDLAIGASYVSTVLAAGYIFTFAALPVGNVLTLRLHREGKLLLPREQFWTGYAIIGLIVGSLAALLSISPTGSARLIALAFAAPVPAISQIAGCRVGWPRSRMQMLVGLTSVCSVALVIGTVWTHWQSPAPQVIHGLVIAITVLLLAVPIASHYLTQARVRL